MTVHEPQHQPQPATRADAAALARTQLSQAAQLYWTYQPPYSQPGVGPWHLVGGGKPFWSFARSYPATGQVVNQFSTNRPGEGEGGPIRGFSEAGFRVDFRAPASGLYLVDGLFHATSVTNVPGGGTCRTTGLLGVRGADGYVEDLPDLPVGGHIQHTARLRVITRMNGGATTRITVGSAIEIIRRYYSTQFWRTYGEVIGQVQRLAIFRLGVPQGPEIDGPEVEGLEGLQPAAGSAPEDGAEVRSDAADFDAAEVLRQRSAALTGDGPA